jgi:hypothetical protein
LPWRLWLKRVCMTVARDSLKGAALGVRLTAKHFALPAAGLGSVAGAITAGNADASLFMRYVMGGLFLGALAPGLVGALAGLIGGGFLGARAARQRWHWARTL